MNLIIYVDCLFNRNLKNVLLFILFVYILILIYIFIIKVSLKFITFFYS